MKIRPSLFRKAARLIESGKYIGCCMALSTVCPSGDSYVSHIDFLSDVMAGHEETHLGYWWPIDWWHDRCEEADTPRLIALELAALIAEENQS